MIKHIPGEALTRAQYDELRGDGPDPTFKQHHEPARARAYRYTLSDQVIDWRN